MQPNNTMTINQLTRRPEAYRLQSTVYSLALVLTSLIWAGDATAQTSQTEARLTYLRELIRARDPGAPPLLYAKFEIEISGPAALFPVPRTLRGENYRQVNVQEWWAQDQKIAVVTHAEMTAWLDDAVIRNVPPNSGPGYTQCFDGERAYYHDQRAEGRVLEVNSRWPFRNAAYPVLFGRNRAAKSIGEILDDGPEYVGEDSSQNRPCSVIRLRNSTSETKLWLAHDLGGLCTKVEVYAPRGLAFDANYQFAVGPAGFHYPVSGTERQINERGQVRTVVWRTLDFQVNPAAPPDLFAPSAQNADVVLDAATGAVLKAPDQE
ncbi:MAG: hypothetical protein HY706_01935 [Candidatus Hydrogenedentes bacterium]|nr:hypothetical protein [Candidatus Hydrogenedentota bacterium]